MRNTSFSLTHIPRPASIASIFRQYHTADSTDDYTAANAAECHLHALWRASKALSGMVEEGVRGFFFFEFVLV